MLGTKDRYDINNIYNKWISNKSDLDKTSGSLILWLQTHGMLNESVAKNYIAHNLRR